MPEVTVATDTEAADTKRSDARVSAGVAGAASRVAAIARNTFREAVRDRVLYNLVLFVLILTGGAVFLGELSAAQETKIIVDMGLSAALLFGAFIAYFTMPYAIEFLIGYSGPVTAAFTPNKYVSLLSIMMLAFGVGFLFPVLLVFLQLVSVITPKQLSHWRRQAIVVVVVTAAVITPSGDPYSLFALAVPMYVFYECSIVIGWFLTRNRRKDLAAHPG